MIRRGYRHEHFEGGLGLIAFSLHKPDITERSKAMGLTSAELKKCSNFANKKEVVADK